jgi:putative NADH-flavin reductase
MRLAVLGATGGTGAAVVTQALERGHEVVVLARRPEAVAATHQRLRVVKADATDEAALAAGLDGAEAVISALGAPQRDMLRPAPITVYTQSGRALLAAMARAGLDRLVAVTSGGVEHEDPSFGFFYRWVLKPLLLERAYRDMRAFEDQVRASGLRWTLARPSQLTDDPPTGRFRVSPRFAPAGGAVIRRGDLAAFLLDTAEQGTWIHGTPTLAE